MINGCKLKCKFFPFIALSPTPCDISQIHQTLRLRHFLQLVSQGCLRLRCFFLSSLFLGVEMQHSCLFFFLPSAARSSLCVCAPLRPLSVPVINGSCHKLAGLGCGGHFGSSSSSSSNPFQQTVRIGSTYVQLSTPKLKLACNTLATP